MLCYDTLSLTLSSLPVNDLASSSLVCRAWQTTAFPYLYHTVRLKLAQHVEELAKRVLQDDNVLLSPRAHIRRLSFDVPSPDSAIHDKGCLAEAALERLAVILLQLIRLEHFSWGANCVPRNSGVTEALQIACPSLTSLQWTIEDDNWRANSYEDYSKLFQFTNLSHFSLSIRRLPFAYNDDYFQPLIGLLQACPNLQSLTLDLRNLASPAYIWFPEVLFDILGSPTFPDLHTFRALGTIALNWHAFFDAPDSSPLRMFFRRHPNLHTVSLGWADRHLYYRVTNSSDISVLLPSLKYLDAPAFFCEPVLSSCLADTLESLEITDGIYDHTGRDLQIIAALERPLSKLRRLVIKDWRDETIQVGSLAKFLSMTPALQELRIHVSLEFANQLLGLLPLVPKLRALRLNSATLRRLSEEAAFDTSFRKEHSFLSCIEGVAFESRGGSQY